MRPCLDPVDDDGHDSIGSSARAVTLPRQKLPSMIPAGLDSSSDNAREE
jgi:hypothetical protein